MKDTLSAGLKYLHDNKTTIFIDSKKGSEFPYIFEPASDGGTHYVQGVKVFDTQLGITVRLFFSEHAYKEFHKDLLDTKDLTVDDMNDLLESFTALVFIPWTTIVAVEL
jgi:hypothetical protein